MPAKTLWGDMTERMRQEKVLHFVRRRGWSYTETADYLHASKNAVAGALARAEGRSEDGYPIHWGRTKKKRATADDRANWTEERLTETWAERKARRAQEKANEGQVQVQESQGAG